jgi:hypothetical protein
MQMLLTQLSRKGFNTSNFIYLSVASGPEAV